MSRVLIGWELGAGSGHHVKIADVARALVARGHQPVLAVQQIGTVPAEWPVWQAPLWPTQLATLARGARVTPATMGDILTVLGLGDRAALRAMLLAWDGILRAVRPDAIVAEFAPALTMAARGRVPTLALGTGFSLPPAHLPIFPSLTGRPAAHDEMRLLETVNAALGGAGQPLLDRLPAIFAVDRECPAVFRELDPYREWRLSAYAAPSVMGVPALSTGTGDELFIYLNGLTMWPTGFWEGVRDSGLKVRAYDARLTADDARVLEGAGLIVERAPVPIDLIVARSRLVLSYGGLGLACSALLAGLPMAVVPFDIEKKMIAASLAELGLGVRLDHELVTAERLAATLRATAHDDAVAARARAVAPGFRARMGRSCEQTVVDEVEALLA